MTALLDRVPAQDLDSERATLGACLMEREAVARVKDNLRPEDFYAPAHGTLYRAILDLHQSARPVDVVTVQAILADREQLAEVGGKSYLIELMEPAPTAAVVEHYAEIVAQKSRLRQLAEVAHRAQEACYAPGSDPEAISSHLAERLVQIGRRRLDLWEHIRDAAGLVYDEIASQQEHGKSLLGMDTHIPSLNESILGWQLGLYHLVGGRPSSGKSAFVFQQACLAAEAGQRVAVFSLEMGRSMLMRRYLARVMGVDLELVNLGKVGDLERVATAFAPTSHWRMWLCYAADLTISQLRAAARALAAQQGGLDMLVVDYLQLVDPDRFSGNRNDELTQISKSLKGLARELNCAVLVPSQLNRACEVQRRWADLRDLRESGSLEQDGDVILFLHYPRWDKDFPQNARGLRVAKQRNGPIGRMWISWSGAYQRFAGLDEYHVGGDDE